SATLIVITLMCGFICKASWSYQPKGSRHTDVGSWLPDVTRAVTSILAAGHIGAPSTDSSMQCGHGDERLADGGIRCAPTRPAGGGVPHAGLAERGRGRRPGCLAGPESRQHQRYREPWEMVDDRCRAGMS